MAILALTLTSVVVCARCFCFVMGDDIFIIVRIERDLIYLLQLLNASDLQNKNNIKSGARFLLTTYIKT